MKNFNELHIEALEAYAKSGKFDHVYGEPEWNASMNQVHPAFAQEVQAMTGKDVLEIGPGGGRATRFLAKAKPRRLVMVDGTMAAEVVTRSIVDFTGIQEEFYASRDGLLPFLGDSSIDVAFSWDVFVHFPKVLLEAYFGEIARVLRKGGQAVIHYGKPYPGLTQDLVDRASFYYRTDEEIGLLLDSLGLRLERREEFHRGGGSCLIVATKL